MTSIAFIAGVFPLVKSHGAGAEMRQAMGIAVFSGMIGVTLFGLFLTPVFYVTLMKLGWKKKPASAPEADHHDGAPVSDPARHNASEPGRVGDRRSGAMPGLGSAGAAAAIVLLFSLASTQAGWLKVGPDY